MFILIYRIYSIPLLVDIVQTKTTVVTDSLGVQDTKGAGNVKLERRAGRGGPEAEGPAEGLGLPWPPPSPSFLVIHFLCSEMCPEKFMYLKSLTSTPR